MLEPRRGASREDRRGVLVVSFYFPPAGGPGVQRTLKSVKYLRRFGWEPVVLTVNGSDYGGHSPLRMHLDSSLEVEVPPELTVCRTPSRQPFKLLELLSRLRLDLLRDWLWVPDPAIHWLVTAWRHGRRLIQEHGCRAIYTSAPPYSTALVGLLLKADTGLPWIADFRDPWTHYFLGRWPTRFHHLVESRMERRVVKEADALVFVTAGSRDLVMEAYPEVPAERFHVVPNGYDFEPVTSPIPSPGRRRNGSPPEHDVVKLVYAGSFLAPARTATAERRRTPLHRRLRHVLEYRHRTFSPEAHSPHYLLRAIEQLAIEEPEDAERLRLTLVGDHEHSRAAVEAAGLQRLVSFTGYLDHAEVERRLREATALLVCLADPERLDERNDCTPQKVFEYLGYGKPILALVPPGDARDLIERSGLGIIAAPRDVGEIKSGLRDLLEGRKRFDPDVGFIRAHRRVALTARLAEILDHVA